MKSIQNLIHIQTPYFDKIASRFACTLTITTIASTILESMALPPNSFFSAIVQFSTSNSHVLLSTSILTWTMIFWNKVKESHQKIRLDPVDYLADELCLKILSTLTPTEVGKCGRVNKKWRNLVSDPTLWKSFNFTKFFPSLTIIDERDWNAICNLSDFGLDVEGLSPLNIYTTIPVFKKFSSLPIEENEGFTLLTLPKGLTFNLLKTITKDATQNNQVTPINLFNLGHYCSFSKELENRPIDKAYRVVISNNILKKSRNLPFEKQMELLTSYACEDPKFLEAVTLISLTLIRFQRCLYTESPWTYTCCSEHLNNLPIVVGGSNQKMLSAFVIFTQHEHYGMCAVQRLEDS